HASNGIYYSNMRRTGFSPVETGGAGILYVQRYVCSMIDDSAKELYVNMKFDNIEIDVIEEIVPLPGNLSNLYELSDR
ncbi:MAG: hypothetical protein ABI892_01040, partial [Flavobacterium sp.]